MYPLASFFVKYKESKEDNPWKNLISISSPFMGRSILCVFPCIYENTRILLSTVLWLVSLTNIEYFCYNLSWQLTHVNSQVDCCVQTNSWDLKLLWSIWSRIIHSQFSKLIFDLVLLIAFDFDLFCSILHHCVKFLWCLVFQFSMINLTQYVEIESQNKHWYNDIHECLHGLSRHMPSNILQIEYTLIVYI